MLRTAHLHANLLGFISMMIFGVAYHVLPRFSGRPLHAPRLAAAHLILANSGLALQTIGWIAGGYAGVGALLFRSGALLSATGTFFFIHNVWHTVGTGVTRMTPAAAERLVAFSCKGRGACPSCNARRMVEVAAHLTDQVLPPLPVRQWVLSLPKRIRPFLPHDPRLAGDVLRVVLRGIRTALRHASPGAPGDAQLGAVSFLRHAVLPDCVHHEGPLHGPHGGHAAAEDHPDHTAARHGLVGRRLDQDPLPVDMKCLNWQLHEKTRAC